MLLLTLFFNIFCLLNWKRSFSDLNFFFLWRLCFIVSGFNIFFIVFFFGFSLLGVLLLFISVLLFLFLLLSSVIVWFNFSFLFLVWSWSCFFFIFIEFRLLIRIDSLSIVFNELRFLIYLFRKRSRLSWFFVNNFQDAFLMSFILLILFCPQNGLNVMGFFQLDVFLLIVVVFKDMVPVMAHL